MVTSKLEISWSRYLSMDGILNKAAAALGVLFAEPGPE